MSFLKLRSKQRGYVLLLLMLGIGSLALYLSYQLSLQKMNTQSWQLAKTATEFSYWLDIEQNYEQDAAATLNTGDPHANYNSIQLLDLIQNKHYLPYGLARAPTFTSSTYNSVSEFLCSPLPGINKQDVPLALSGVSNTCPIQSIGSTTLSVHCDLASTDTIYYSCANNATTSQAQYYVNANYIALGNLLTSSTALGLILRTPGLAKDIVQLQQTGYASRGLLPNNSVAQSLMSTLPGSAFNVYTTQIAQVNGIGIGSYVSQSTSQQPQTNNRYSKIVDMGLVQAVKIDDTGANAPKCYGWDANGNKIGVQNSYIGGSNDPGTGTRFPPTCIRIDTSKYPLCKRIDVLYTMYRNSTKAASRPSQFYSYTDSYVQVSGTVRNVFLSQSFQTIPSSGGVKKPIQYTYTSNGDTTTTSGPNAYDWTWLAYIVRCTQDNV